MSCISSTDLLLHSLLLDSWWTKKNKLINPAEPEISAFLSPCSPFLSKSTLHTMQLCCRGRIGCVMLITANEALHCCHQAQLWSRLQRSGKVTSHKLHTIFFKHVVFSPSWQSDTIWGNLLASCCNRWCHKRLYTTFFTFFPQDL